jgi:hypothetical protein
MTTRLDAVAVSEYTDRGGEKRSKFTRIGTAWETKNGGWSVELDALPVATMGERGVATRFLLMVPKEKDDRSEPIRTSSGTHRPTGGGGFKSRQTLTDDGDIPFAAPVL